MRICGIALQTQGSNFEAWLSETFIREQGTTPALTTAPESSGCHDMQPYGAKYDIFRLQTSLHRHHWKISWQKNVRKPNK